MKGGLYLFFSLLCFSLGSCEEKPLADAEEKHILTAEDAAKDTESYYKSMIGTIAGQSVVMHLHKNGNQYDVIYYYQKSGEWLYLEKEESGEDHLVFLEHTMGDLWSGGTESEARLVLKWQDGGLIGNWTNKKKSYTVEFKETYPSGSLRFTLLSLEDTMSAYPGNDSIVAHFEFSTVVASDHDWLNKQLLADAGMDKNRSFEDGFKEKANSYFKEYKEELPEINDSDSYYYLNYSSELSNFVRFNQDNYVVIESYFYEYTGGAHGNYGYSYSCYDILNKKKLKLNDVISADTVLMQNLLEKNFRKQYHISEPSLSEVLFTDKIRPNENFYFNERGMGFVYGPYEIASYAQGSINIFIPFKELEQYLNPELRKRLKY